MFDLCFNFGELNIKKCAFPTFAIAAFFACAANKAEAIGPGLKPINNINFECAFSAVSALLHKFHE
ncbi:hypothetical protein FEV53_14415 [Palleronia caenipelagi]|uniref:Uncharacterized protein n=1 Tax=Palleronia caenipelagi TaxID=2489174 RepID=A0A547PQ25_9RHOB|nr:hypothetical protein FEV53_14415 [Palleronia caenipelagi]